MIVVDVEVVLDVLDVLGGLLVNSTGVPEEDVGLVDPSVTVVVVVVTTWGSVVVGCIIVGCWVTLGSVELGEVTLGFTTMGLFEVEVEVEVPVGPLHNLLVTSKLGHVVQV